MFFVRVRSIPKLVGDKREYLRASIKSSLHSVIEQGLAKSTPVKTRFSSGTTGGNGPNVTVEIYELLGEAERTNDFHSVLAEVVGMTVKYICPDFKVLCYTNTRATKRGFWSSETVT